MADIMRIRSVIAGTQGTPGLSTLYAVGSLATPVAADALDMVGRVRAFWNAIITLLPTLTTVNVQSQVDLLDVATGALVGGLAPAAPATVTGTGGSALPFAAAALLVGNTGIVINGRRLQGRTFISPLAATTNNAGNFGNAQQTTLTNAANAMLTGSSSSFPVVWHRPKAPGPAGGVGVAVLTYTARTPYAILRSRRD
jgi:hypothetical protein